ncbi:hypothetical protein A6S26_32540 [Nostoc sp. ATCC 43529]|nr:hypothetical protein A6S26_32540 [Nostoc sp. ATCC 43529]
MTESLEISAESLEMAESFATAINTLYQRVDYLRFCEILGYTPDDWAEGRYQQFQELVSYLDCFDKEEIAKMLEAGK